jgi:hypothetical protein
MKVWIVLLLLTLTLHAQIPLDEVVHIPDVFTFSPSTGEETAADATPKCSVYEEDTDTAIIILGSMVLRTATTNDYRYSFTASTANGFEVSKWYNVNCYATVGGIAGEAQKLHFRVLAAENTPGYPLDAPVFLKNTAVTNFGIYMQTPGGVALTSLTTGQITCFTRLDGASWAPLTDSTEAEIGGSGNGKGNYIVDITAVETNGTQFNLLCTGPGAIDYRIQINTQH